MSADNWTRCPKCELAETEQRKNRRKQVDDSYGKVPAEQYIKMLRTVDEEEDAPYPQTLREDYAVGIYDGAFSVNYSAGCSECGYSFTYTDTVPALTDTPVGKAGEKKE